MSLNRMPSPFADTPATLIRTRPAVAGEVPTDPIHFVAVRNTVTDECQFSRQSRPVY
jgi:hypothetical protein